MNPHSRWPWNENEPMPNVEKMLSTVPEAKRSEVRSTVFHFAMMRGEHPEAVAARLMPVEQAPETTEADEEILDAIWDEQPSGISGEFDE